MSEIASPWRVALQELQREDSERTARNRALFERQKPKPKLAPRIIIQLHLAVSGRKQRRLTGWCLLKEGEPSHIHAELS